MKGTALDRMIYALVTRGLDSAAIKGYAKAVENQQALASAPAFQTIDTKATGTLTHVSMMIAGLGICAPLLAQHPLEEAVIIAQIAVYLIIAVGCLRCLSVVRSLRERSAGDAVKQHVQRELIIRHEIYRICNMATIYFTVIVFITLPLMLWWKPPV